MLEIDDLTRDMPGRTVDTCELPDGRLRVRVKGVVVPFSAYDPDQWVGHAAITKNGHLGAVLAHIKAEQDVRPAPKVQVRPRSANGGYKPTARRALRLELQALHPPEGPTGRRSRRPRGRSGR